MFRSRRLFLYVLGELAVASGLALVLYTFTLMMNEFFLIAQKAISRNLAWDLVLRLFLYSIPRILVYAIPMATLLGTMIAVGRLSADHEWVAMQGLGVGPKLLLRPALLHGLFASMMAFVVYSELTPLANHAVRDLMGQVYFSSNLAADLRSRVFYDDLPGAVLYVSEIPAGSSGQLTGVFIYQPGTPAGASESIILARRGELTSTSDGTGSLRLDLQDGILHSFRVAAPESYLVSRFGRYVLEFAPPDFMKALRAAPASRTVQDMGTRALLAELQVAATETDPILKPFRLRSVHTEIHQRLALPLASLLFALLAVPLGITRVRSGKGAGFALSMAVIFAYWIVFTVSRDQAIRGRIPIFLGVWAANLLMLAWFLSGIARMRGVAADRSRFIGLLTRAARSIASPKVPYGRWIGGGRRDDSATERSFDRPQRRWGALVDGYLVRGYLRILALALASTYLIYALVELRGLLDGVVQNRRPLILVARYFAYFAPGMLQFVLPVSCLVAGVTTFTVLSRRGEMTALKAAGMSVRRAAVPVVLCTSAICVLLFLIQDQIAPVTNRKAQETRDLIFNRPPRSYGHSPGGHWSFGSGNRLYQYRLYDQEHEMFQGLSVFTLDSEKLRILDHRFAATARWNGDSWQLARGWQRSFPENGPPGTLHPWERTNDAEVDPPENFSRHETTLALGNDLPEQLSLRELKDQISSLRRSGYDTTRFEVGYFAKLSLPFTPLVMLLLGLPFAFRIGRSGSLYAVGVSLGLAIVYWATLAVFNALGLETVVPAVLSAWAPNILYGFLGVYLLLYVKT